MTNHDITCLKNSSIRLSVQRLCTFQGFDGCPISAVCNMRLSALDFSKLKNQMENLNKVDMSSF